MRFFRASAGSAVAFLFLFASVVSAQSNRIGQRIDRTNRVALAGHLHPKAHAANDQGRVSPSLQLSYVTLTLQQSAAQKAALDQLLIEQQTPGSPNFHRWLTP